MGRWPTQRQGTGQNWSSGLCLALCSAGDWQDGTFQLQVGGRAPSHRLSCLTLPVSIRLKSLSGRVRFRHPAGSWRNWRELLLSPSCFSLGKHICWRHLASPGSLSESQCRCPRPCARTARNQQVLGAGPPVQASCSASGISPRVGRLDQGWPVQCLWTFDSYTLPSILWVK